LEAAPSVSVRRNPKSAKSMTLLPPQNRVTIPFPQNS
jgi:hypothetical protein